MINFKNIKPEILGQSQKGQCGIIDGILNQIDEVNPYFVEFGAVDGIQSSNSYHLRVNKGWKGLLLEGGQSNPSINLQNEFLTADNICDIFYKYGVPNNPGVISCDVDGQDFWILNSILQEYSPALVVVETCVRFNPEISLVQKYNPNWQWNGKTVYGSTPLAFKRMAAKYGMSPVGLYLDDLFLVDDNFLTDDEQNVDFGEIYAKNNVDLYESHGNCYFDPENFEEYE